jgi:hypothetical protein
MKILPPFFSKKRKRVWLEIDDLPRPWWQRVDQGWMGKGKNNNAIHSFLWGRKNL